MSSSSRNLNDHRHRRASLVDTESARLAAYEIDDLLSSTGGGKHDYDWLLTPPGTPDFPPSKGESRPTLAPPRSSLGRSTSNTNVSRVTASHNHNQSRLPAARSSSVSRSSMSSSQEKKNYSLNRSSSSILNTRPSSPTTRSTSAARSSTPSRSSADKTRPSSSIPNLHSPSAPARSLSRPSTPTRRHSMSSPSPTAAAAISRPSSPGPRLRPPPKPVVPPDFPLETPPNLRTALPHRPVSAGRSRPGAVALKPNSEKQSSRTHYSPPVVNRGRLSLSGKGHADAGRLPLPLPHAPEAQAHTFAWKSTVAADKNGFGRTISKRSMDVAIRHMDIRNGSASVGRPLSSATLFPQSIRKGKTQQQPSRGLTLSASASVDNDTNGRGRGRELSEVDRYQYQSLSSRYDAHAHARLLLTQDHLNSTNWLHSVDDQRPIFDNGFESLPLPEPFALL